MYVRISNEDSKRLQREYEDIEMYNVIINPIEKHESRKGGLMPWEVFDEVLHLEEELTHVKRLDRYVNSQRTILEQRYSEIAPDAVSAKNNENIVKRTKQESERSALCVLLTLGMRLASYDDNAEEFPYENVCEQIRAMALECEDLQMVTDICYGLWNSEQEEENMGYEIPPEDVLHKKEASKIEDIKAAIAVFNERLDKADARQHIIKKAFEETYDQMWRELIEDEILGRSLMEPVPKMHMDYNIKLVLNIYGMMFDSDVFKIGGIEPLCNILFTHYDEQKRKTVCPSWGDYMRSYNYKDYSNKYSALNDILKQQIQNIIERNRN